MSEKRPEEAAASSADAEKGSASEEGRKDEEKKEKESEEGGEMEDSGESEGQSSQHGEEKQGMKRPRDNDDNDDNEEKSSGSASKNKKGKKASKKARKDEDAEVDNNDGDEDDDEDDEDEDEDEDEEDESDSEDENRFEDDGFVVADDDDDEGEETDKKRRRKHHHHKASEDDLEEGDLSVIKEANPKLYKELMAKRAAKKGKRLHRAESDGESESESEKEDKETETEKTDKDAGEGHTEGADDEDQSKKTTNLAKDLFSDTNEQMEEEEEEEEEEEHMSEGDMVDEEEEDEFEGGSSRKKRFFANSEYSYEAQEFFREPHFTFDDDDDDENYANMEEGPELNREEEEDIEVEGDVGSFDQEGVEDEIAVVRAGYDPDQIEGKMLGTSDVEIQDEDFPERFLLRRRELGLDDETLSFLNSKESLDKEARWILIEEFSGVIADVESEERYLKQISAALDFFHIKGLEPYFVYIYRHSSVKNFSLNQLWSIYDRDTEYMKMEVTKRRLLQNAVVQSKECKDLGEAIKDARSEQDLQDFADYLKTKTFAIDAEADLKKEGSLDEDGHSSPDGAAASEPKIDEDLLKDYEKSADDEEKEDKNADDDDMSDGAAAAAVTRSRQKSPRPVHAFRRDLYSQCCRCNFRELANKFCLSASQFFENIDFSECKNTPPDPEEPPEILAEAYVCGRFTTPEHVLRGVRSMIAKEIADDWRIRRKLIRAMYERDVTINTQPTVKRARELTFRHAYACVRKIRGKRISDFQDASFLTILNAESDGFINVNFEISSASHNKYIDTLQSLFCGRGTSTVAQLWNEQRLEILDEALKSFVYPSLEKQVRRKLTDAACEYVLNQSAQELQKRVVMRPYDADKGEDDQTDLLAAFALSENHAENRVPSVTCVLIDRFGQPQEYITLPNLALPGRRRRDMSDDPNARNPKADDVDKLRDFMKSHHPLVGVLPASSPEILEVENVLQQLKSEDSLDKRFDIIYVDPCLPRIFSRSERSVEEFPRSTIEYRFAVSVGRLVENPIAEYCALCKSPNSRDLFSLLLHPSLPLVAKIRRERAVAVLHRLLSNVVASVGVNILDAVNYTSQSGLIQFVPGLGPRKARKLIEFAHKGLPSRKALEDSVFGKVVYTNCAPFLRILTHGYSDDRNSNPVDYFDETRISPEQYGEAGIIVAKVMGKKRENASVALEKFYRERKQQMLAEELHKEGSKLHKYFMEQPEEKRALLEFIAKEISDPFQDQRKPFRRMSKEDVNRILAGDGLNPGDFVSVRLVHVDDRNYPHVIINNGLRFTVVDDEVPELTDSRNSGNTIQCSLRKIDFSRLQVELSKKPLDDLIRRNLLKQERFLDTVTPDDVPETPRKKGEETQGTIPFPRITKHILFRNSTAEDVEKELKDQRVGSVLIRPSSSTNNKLVMHWKMSKNIIALIDIEEVNKAGPLYIGRTLRIGKQTFGDFDELYGTYVEPMNETARSIAHFRYFRNGSKKEINDMLAESKKKDPKRTPYFVSLSEENKGYYLLAFMPRESAKHLYFSIGPGKLILRDREFSDIEQLISYFKDHSEELLKPPKPKRSQRDSRGYDHRDDRHHHHSHRHHRYSRSRSRSRSYSRSGSRSSSRDRHDSFVPFSAWPNSFGMVAFPPMAPYKQ